MTKHRRRAFEKHRGPFVLFIVRTVKGRKLPIESKWLKGHVDKADVIDEATILLGDPRDTIQTVSLWSVKEEQFVDTIKRREVR